MTAAGGVLDREQFEATFAAIAVVSTVLAQQDLAPPTNMTPREVVKTFLSRNVGCDNDIELAMASSAAEWKMLSWPCWVSVKEKSVLLRTRLCI